MVNLFILDKNLQKSAEYTMDAHISRGILEAAMVFFTVRSMLNIQEKHKVYRPSHKYHSIVKWAQKSLYNYEFLYSFTHYLNIEYKIRYNKSQDHLSFSKMQQCYKDLEEIAHLFEEDIFEHPCQAMPFVFQQSKEMYVEAYRMYYFFHKRFALPFVSWRNRSTPEWFNYRYFFNNKLIPCDYI